MPSPARRALEDAQAENGVSFAEAGKLIPSLLKQLRASDPSRRAEAAVRLGFFRDRSKATRLFELVKDDWLWMKLPLGPDAKKQQAALREQKLAALAGSGYWDPDIMREAFLNPEAGLGDASGT